MSQSLVLVYTLPRDPRRGKPRPPLILAYLTYQGTGACEHTVEGLGEEAKRAAIREHREKCAKETPHA